jgi:hypothetical protein
MNEKDVVAALVAQLSDHGLQMKVPDCMMLLYRTLPAAKLAVKACGGPKAFCARHGELEFVPSAGAGEIRLHACSRKVGSSLTHSKPIKKPELSGKAPKSQQQSSRTATRESDGPKKSSGGVKPSSASTVEADAAAHPLTPYILCGHRRAVHMSLTTYLACRLESTTSIKPKSARPSLRVPSADTGHGVVLPTGKPIYATHQRA